MGIEFVDYIQQKPVYSPEPAECMSIEFVDYIQLSSVVFLYVSVCTSVEFMDYIQQCAKGTDIERGVRVK